MKYHWSDIKETAHLPASGEDAGEGKLNPHLIKNVSTPVSH
jgi:hypothetical protein